MEKCQYPPHSRRAALLSLVPIGQAMRWLRARGLVQWSKPVRALQDLPQAKAFLSLISLALWARIFAE
jgi:hypothetical protein